MSRFYQLNTLYSITINPCDKYQFFRRKERLALFRNKLYEMFVSRWCDYDLYIELSEPRDTLIHKYQGARLHIHGYIGFTHKDQLLHFLLYEMGRLCQLGSINIDTVSNVTTWTTYCHKQELFSKCYRRISNFVDPVEFMESIGKIKKN